MLMELFLPAVDRTSDEDSVIYLEVARHLEFFDHANPLHGVGVAEEDARGQDEMEEDDLLWRTAKGCNCIRQIHKNQTNKKWFNCDATLTRLAQH